jgi:hypothetical protein
MVNRRGDETCEPLLAVGILRIWHSNQWTRGPQLAVSRGQVGWSEETVWDHVPLFPCLPLLPFVLLSDLYHLVSYFRTDWKPAFDALHQCRLTR